MTDEHWLRAIAKYRSEDRVRSSGGELKGGAWQFAQALEARVKEEPERFARLSLRFPPDANPVYLERTLAALKGAAVASDLKLQVCRKAFAESRGPCGQSIADLMGSIEESLPEDAVEILSWLATEHEDPTTEAWQQDAGGGQTYSNGDIHTNGINTTRGRAADAIRDLILTDAVYVDRFRTTLDQMLQDQSVCVRSCVAGALRAVTCRDPALGMSLFRKLDLSQDRLLATDHVYHFILGGLREHLVEVRPIVERMLGSSEPEVCEAGARLASLSALINASAVDLADEAMRGSSRHRLGVAQVASAYIAVPGCRAWCEATLAALFDDDDADVMREAASCFHHLRDEPLESYGDLVAVFCDSRAFQEDSVSILYVLEESLGRLPGMTCVVCEKLLHRFTDEARDVQSKRFVDPGIVARLIFRTYQQHQNDEWTSRSLDLIDRICLERIPDAGHEFEQFER